MYCTVLYCTLLNYAVLYCTELYCTVTYCVLHCTQECILPPGPFERATTASLGRLDIEEDEDPYPRYCTVVKRKKERLDYIGYI